jgi:RND family efflux transporter MFP subunit
LAASLAACGGHAAPEGEHETEIPAAEVVTVERATLTDTRVLRGVIDTPPDRRASVAAEIAGRINEVPVREGDAVEAGALLAVIDPGPASDARAAASAHLEESSVAVASARTARDHVAHLVERGIAPRAQLEEADAHLAALQAAAQASRVTVREAGRGVSRTRVTSPLAGVVVRVVRRPGETVDGTPGTPIVEVADVSALELACSAAPRDLLALAADQPVSITVDGLDAPLPGHVRSVAPALDPSTGTGSVRIALDPLARALPLGLAGEARVNAGTHDGLVVPDEAVRASAEGTPEVLVCEGGAAHATAVVVGQRSEGRAELVEGVPAGALVVHRAIGREDGSACGEAAEATP